MDPALKFIVDVQNSEEVKRLTALINQQKEAIAQLNTQLKAGAINNAQFAATALPMGQNIANATTALHAIPVAAGSSGRALGQLSYAIDDIQYGFNAIVNNIPQIVLALGGGMGIAGAVGIAAVAVNQLMKHWTELIDTMTQVFSGTPVGQLEEIRAKAEEAATAFEKLSKTPTSARSAETEKIGKAITEAGIEGVTQQVAIGVAQDPRLAAKVKEEAAGRGFGPGQIPTPGKSREEADREEAVLNRKTAERLVGESQIPGPRGDAARIELAAMARKNPESFPQTFAADLEKATPAGQKKERERLENESLIKEATDNQNKAQFDQSDRMRKAELDNQKFINDLNDQGLQNQKAAAEERKRDQLQDLADQQTKIHDQMRFRTQNLERIAHNMGQSQIIGGGAKAVVDMFQKAAGDAPMVAILKAIKTLNDKDTINLDIIAKEIVKEQRVKPLGG